MAHMSINFSVISDFPLLRWIIVPYKWHVLKGETSKRNDQNETAETIETTETTETKRPKRNGRNETAENINYRKNGKY
jgi:hypothetical protein